MGYMYRIFGPPGTGKTTRLVQIMSQEISDGIHPDRIAYTSFTRAAAKEAKHRVLRDIPYDADDEPAFSNVGTIHSIAYRLLGLDRSQVFNGGRLREFGKKCGYEFTDSEREEDVNLDTELQDMMLSKPGDYFEHFVNWWQNMMLPFDEAYKRYVMMTPDLPGDFSYGLLKKYIKDRNNYKQENALWDFSDMLTGVLNQRLCPEIDVLIGDEMQDSSPLLFKVAEMWADEAERAYFAGDPYQCLPPGTKVATPWGDKNIEDMNLFDKVLCALIPGKYGEGFVVNKMQYDYTGDLIKVSLESGKEIYATPNHEFFWYWDRPSATKRKSIGYWYVYLMKRGSDWRIGKTNNPPARLTFEHGAEGILPIYVCDDENEAYARETIWSLQYGIPQTVFWYEGRDVLPSWLIDRIFSEVDSQAGALRLLADLGKKWKGYVRPQAVMAGKVKRKWVNLQALQTEHGMHRKLVWWESGDYRSKRANFHNLENARKYAQREAERIGADDVFEKWAFTRKHMFMPTPASNLVPGCYLPIMRDGSIVPDKVINVERVAYSGKVYDLEVDPSNNYCANSVFVHNSLYSFMGAVPDLVMDMPTDETEVLRQSYRCPAATQALAEKIKQRFSRRYQSDYFYPRDAVGSVEKSFFNNIDWHGLASDSKSVFYLLRTRYLVNKQASELMMRGVPFVTFRGRKSPLQKKGSVAAQGMLNLLGGKYIPIGMLRQMVESVPSRPYLEHGVKTNIANMANDTPDVEVNREKLPGLGFTDKFFEKFNDRDFWGLIKGIPEDDRLYLSRVAKTYGVDALGQTPNISMGTGHSSKGAERDIVIIDPQFTRRVSEAFKLDSDSEHRLAYVEITRAREKAIILYPDTFEAYPL